MATADRPLETVKIVNPEPKAEGACIINRSDYDEKKHVLWEERPAPAVSPPASEPPSDVPKLSEPKPTPEPDFAKPEPTPAEKAAKTRAANKAKADAERE